MGQAMGGIVTVYEREMVDELTIHGELPEPWTLEQINPCLELHRYGQRDPLKMGYSDTFSDILKGINRPVVEGPDRIIFITHGLLSDIRAPWMEQARDKILRLNRNQLVILVGWGDGATNLISYHTVMANMTLVAHWLAEKVSDCCEVWRRYKGADKDLNIWGIGHCLGAHLMGLAGRESGKFCRITALDPTGPGFEPWKEDNEHKKARRLKKMDAREMVDVIHTDGFSTPSSQQAPVNHYGTQQPMGSIDFYPNFGMEQPGFELDPVLSHNFSTKLFIWSIENKGMLNTKQILAESPKAWKPVKQTSRALLSAEMGYWADDTNLISGGAYYLKTNETEPWVSK